MIEYRPFLNTDPPAIAEIWRSQPPQRGLMQPMSPALLERHVLAKPYFDRQGLIVAVDDRRPVGFVHATVSPCGEGAASNGDVGRICMLLVAPHAHKDAIAAELLGAAEEYLQRSGATGFCAGFPSEAASFYLGLYGGCRYSGVLQSDVFLTKLLRDRGYAASEDFAVLQRSLAGFRPPVDRQLLQLRRKYQLSSMTDPRPHDWREACAVGDTEVTRFFIEQHGNDSTGAAADFWDMEPLAGSWGVHAMGLLRLRIDDAAASAGLGLLLLSESLRQIQMRGATLVEAHAPRSDAVVGGLLARLGFEEVDRGAAMVKSATS